MRSLLRPGGLLALIELTHCPFWPQVTFGLLEGWWAFRDVELRRDSALLSGAQWERLLREEGFDVARASDRSDGEQSVLLARAPVLHVAKNEDRPSGSWIVVGGGDGVGHDLSVWLREGGAEVREVGALDGAPTDSEALAQLVGGVRPRGVVFCATSERASSGRAAVSVTVGGIELVKALARASFEGRVYFVSRGAQIVDPRDESNPSGAALWGLGEWLPTSTPSGAPGSSTSQRPRTGGSSPPSSRARTTRTKLRSVMTAAGCVAGAGSAPMRSVQ